MKFSIGDKAWVALAGPVDKYIQCPDCFGKKFLTVILGDDSRVTIDCCGCSAGYEPPQGVIRTYEYQVSTNQITIDGMETGIGEDTRYKFNLSECSCNMVCEKDVFETREEALVRALDIKDERDRYEFKRLQSKEKPHRDWAWHVTYHRREWKRHLEDAERHKSKLEAAQSHVKSEKVIV